MHLRCCSTLPPPNYSCCNPNMELHHTFGDLNPCQLWLFILIHLHFRQHWCANLDHSSIWSNQVIESNRLLHVLEGGIIILKFTEHTFDFQHQRRTARRRARRGWNRNRRPARSRQTIRLDNTNLLENASQQWCVDGTNDRHSPYCIWRCQ